MSEILLANGTFEIDRPAPGLFRSLTSALGSLARHLSRAEMHIDEADLRQEEDTAAGSNISSDAVSHNAAEFLLGDSSLRFEKLDWSALSVQNLSSLRTGLKELLADFGDGVAPHSLWREDLQPNAGSDSGAGDFSQSLGSLQTNFLKNGDVSEPPSALPPPVSQETGTTESAHTASPRLFPGGAGDRYTILSGKTVGVIGFQEADAIAIGQALAAQRCSFLTLTHADAEFRQGSTAVCDLLLMEVRPEWTTPGSGEMSSLLHTKKPAVLVADRQTLIGSAALTQGYRDFVPAPATAHELVWRAAILLSSCPAFRNRQKKKNRQLQIIIGDDDPSSRTLVHAILAQEGMQCHAADNGAHALALARGKSADAVIVDVNMPGLDGFQVLAEIKRDPALASARVILLTTRQAEADVLRGFGLGADDYVTKPFSPLELAARVKRLLGRAA